MSKIIVPLHFAKLTTTPGNVETGFKKFYLKGEWFKLYNGTSEIDVVLDRPLDNYIPIPGTITSNDTVLTAIEKLDYAISNFSGGTIWGGITGDITNQIDLISYLNSNYLTSAEAATTYFPIPTGTTLQYITGDGSLATFPTVSAGDLEQVLTVGNESITKDAIFRLYANDYFKLNRLNQSLDFYTDDGAGGSFLTSSFGSYISYQKGSIFGGFDFEINPFDGFTVKSGSDGAALTPFNLFISSGGSYVDFQSSYMEFNGKFYNYPNTANSRIATLLDIPALPTPLNLQTTTNNGKTTTNDMSIIGTGTEKLFLDKNQLFLANNGFNTFIGLDRTTSTPYFWINENGKRFLLSANPSQPSGTINLYTPTTSGTLALTSDIISDIIITSNPTTAQNGRHYIGGGSSYVMNDFSSPNSGEGYTVYVPSGNVSIGGIYYYAGALVYRYYNGVSWVSKDFNTTISGGGISHTIATGTDTYTATVTGVTSYADGDAYLVRFTNGNTTGATLNINSLGAIALYRNNDGPLLGGDIVSGAEMLCVYNSTANTFQAIGTSPNSLYAYVTNADSVAITKGMPVYAFGGTGDRMTVKRAFNTGDATSAQTVGLVLSTSIAAGQKGIIMMQGLLDGLSILPTATWSDGDPVYLGATAGTITNVKPYAPNHLVYLGVVTTASNGSAGRLYVRVQNGYELDELHNVQAQTPTLKDTLWYDNTVTPAQWKTASIPTILGYTPPNLGLVQAMTQGLQNLF